VEVIAVVDPTRIDWDSIDAANQLYYDGVIDGEDQADAYVAAVGGDRTLGYCMVAMVARIMGE
jgi:hypothetical protein